MPITALAVVDPAPFLSTVATVSAAMVAIVGGLLVARFVTLQSEQDGAQQLLDDAEGRLTIARNREQKARDRLHWWDVNDFFDRDVIRAINEGTQDIAALRDVGGYTSLTDEQLTEVVQAVVAEFKMARRVLKGLMPASAAVDYPEWETFKRSQEGLPETDWEDVWEMVYNDLITPSQPVWVAPHLRTMNVDTLRALAVRPSPEIVAFNMQRGYDLRTTLDRAKQQVEDIENEVDRLRRARQAVVRPKGLGWGLVILGYFTLTGVIVPVWIMSQAPQQLTALLGNVTLSLFLSGLLALLIYMTALALRLSGWRRKKA